MNIRAVQLDNANAIEVFRSHIFSHWQHFYSLELDFSGISDVGEKLTRGGGGRGGGGRREGPSFPV